MDLSGRRKNDNPGKSSTRNGFAGGILWAPTQD